MAKKKRKRKNPKLTVELVPKTCWYSNIRTTLPTKEWNRLRKAQYAKAEFKCEICEGSGLDQGYRHALECHEIWTYDDNKKVQKLDGLIALCPKCHMTKHFGRSSAIGKQAEVLKHMEVVNGWDHKETVTYIAECFDVYTKRSKENWKLDIGILNEEYGVEKKLITAAQKKRKKL